MNTITFHGSKCHIVFGWPPPPEKDEVKQLGAKWNPRDKVWIAPITYELAEWLRQHGVEIPADVVVPDPPVPELPEGESLEEILAESWATDADIEIPAPNGADYRPFQKAGIAWALKRPGALIGDDMGLGKQQPVSEPVLTPEGWRSIGSLSVGDRVVGSNGQTTKVLAVYPQQCRDVYRVEFSDGSSTRCGLDHLWTVRKIQSEDTTYHTMTTQDLIDIGLEVGWALPLVAPVSFDPVTLPVDPYHLGVAVSQSVGANSEASVVQAKLEGLGIGDALAQDRSIPPPYLRASPKDRLALLQGILDSEGRPTPHGGFEIRLTSHALANEVRELVQSLGGVAETTYDRKGRPAWRINARLPANLCPFREADKRLAWRTPTHYPPSRYIARIVLDVPEDSVCIRVEAKDHLYVTRDYIVTHNTIQALGVVNADPDVGSALIVCPLSVALNWRNEAAKWLAREMSVGVATSKEFPDTDIVIVHWGILAKHTDALRMRDWDLIALDEAHYAKNPRAKRTQAIFGSRSGDKALTAKHKLALTGTPIPNRPIELYPLLKWLAPRQFDNWFNYASKYCAAYKTRYGWDVSGASNLDELQENLRMIMIRRLKKDVLTELPPKTRQVILLDADTPELRAVLHSEAVAQKETEEAITKARIDVELAKAQGPEVYKAAVGALNSAQGLAFTEISRVRHKTALAKIPQVLSHVKDILDNEGQKVIVFAHHRDVIEQLRNGLEASDGDTPGVKTVSIMGGDSPEDRQKAIDSFQNDPATRVFLGSIGAAKEGITLTAADISIFAELDWVPGNLSQAEDRCYRIGQRNSVLVQHLLVDGSIDALMADTILAKQAVLDQALDHKHEGTVTALPDRAPVVNPNSSLIFAQAENGNSWEAKAEGETRSPVEDANDAATSDIPLSEVAKRAEWITPDEIQMVHKGLRLLSGMDWDHAQEVNGIGFSKIDVGIGHDLAGRDTLSPKQAALGAKLTNKYRRQLPEECSRVWNDLKDRMVQAPEIAKEVEDGDKGLEAPVQLGFGLRRGLRCWTHI